jgi:hypothetical protein
MTAFGTERRSQRDSITSGIEGQADTAWTLEISRS